MHHSHCAIKVSDLETASRMMMFIYLYILTHAPALACSQGSPLSLSCDARCRRRLCCTLLRITGSWQRRQSDIYTQTQSHSPCKCYQIIYLTPKQNRTWIHSVGAFSSLSICPVLLVISEVWVAGWMFDSLHGLALSRLAERSPINSDAPWTAFIKYSVLVPSGIQWAMQKTEHPDGKVSSAVDMTWGQQLFLTLGVALKFLDAMSHTGWLYSSHVPGGLLTFEQNSTILNKCNVYKAVCLQCLEKSPVLKFRDCLVSLCGCPETLRVHIVSAVQFSKGKKKKAWGNVWAGFLAPELCSEKY